MCGHNKAFPLNGPVPDNQDDDDDHSFVTEMMMMMMMSPTEEADEVYIVLHDCEFSHYSDPRFANYAPPRTKHTEIISVHYQYEDAAASASRHVRERWNLDKEDEEWLEQLDWHGEGWFDDEARQYFHLREVHRVHIIAMQIH